MNSAFKFLLLTGMVAVSSSIFAETESVVVEAAKAERQEAQQIDAVELEATEEVVPTERQEQFGFTAANEVDTEAVFLGVRLGILDSRDLTVKSSVNPGEDTYTKGSAGLRLGYLLGKWRTYLEYNPEVELESGDFTVKVESYVLATDYALWRSSDRHHRFSVGAYVADVSLGYEVNDVNLEADGFDYGLSAAYRFDVFDWLYLGADARYGLNGVSGPGDSAVNIDKIESTESSQVNLEIGVYF